MKTSFNSDSFLPRLFLKINKPFWISLVFVGAPVILLMMWLSSGEEKGWIGIILAPIAMPVIALEYVFGIVYAISALGYALSKLITKK